jgi:osmoprotectant transport system permease protein
MGLRERQILTRIELPLASSIVVGGLRTATLQVIATATIAAYLGGGGLGRFIIDGMGQGIAGQSSIWAGAILVTALAVGVDLLLAWVQTRLTPAALRKRRGDAPRGPLPSNRPRGLSDLLGRSGSAMDPARIRPGSPLEPPIVEQPPS